MPTTDPIAAARREAKTRARNGGTTHQRALDEIAREAGHPHWRAMTEAAKTPLRPWDEVRPFVDGYLHEGKPIDDDVRALLEDAIHGWLADRPADLGEYVDNYEFRGDGFDHMPDARQRAVMTDALGRFIATRDGPPASTGTLADVETETLRLMRDAQERPGLRISDWVSQRMKEAADRALVDAPPHGRPTHPLRAVRLDARTLAQAADPTGGPWPQAEELTVRCPVHDDANPSLRIAGSGQEVAMACMAGCDRHEVQHRVLGLLAAEMMAASAFVRANDASRVAAGAGLGPEGVGGLGGAYTLEDGSRHTLNPLAGRMLPLGYPRWIHGDDAMPMMELEALVARSLPHGAEYRKEREGDAHVARVVNRDHAVTVRWDFGGPMRLRSCFDDDGSTDTDETFDAVPEAAERMLACAKGFETTDPVRLAEIERRHRAEIACDARHRGTDAEGWGWWVGPNEEEFTWGGPYTTRQYAESMGNGHCGDVGETFFVVQARVEEGGPDADGMHAFSETRGRRRCRAT